MPTDLSSSDSEVTKNCSEFPRISNSRESAPDKLHAASNPVWPVRSLLRHHSYTKPAPPIDHWISDLTYAIQNAILRCTQWFARTETPRRTLCPEIYISTPQDHANEIINSSSPRIEIPKWSGKSWITTCSRSFEITQCHETFRTQMMINAMPLEKTPEFNNITNWTNFKKQFISEFGSIPILAREAYAVFNLFGRLQVRR